MGGGGGGGGGVGGGGGAQRYNLVGYIHYNQWRRNITVACTLKHTVRANGSSQYDC